MTLSPMFLGVSCTVCPSDGLTTVSLMGQNAGMSTPILDQLVQRLKNVGHSRWERVAEAAGVSKTLPRKLAYGDRTDPRISTVQPLIDYFDAVDRGERQLPNPEPSAGHSALVERSPTKAGA